MNTVTDDRTYLVQGKYNEYNQMILVLEVCDVISKWKKVALWYINKKGSLWVDICIEDNKKSMILAPIAVYSDEYNIHEYGFTYNISKAILNNLKHSEETRYEVKFQANLNSDANQIATTNCTKTIIPRICVENANGFILSKLIKLNTNDKPFKVVYKYN
ncbi:hypothetical protein [Vallitalea guaymasensis]|uniref:Uncharacterized protein n=1 Tax=Vallitalea guaymasensis TaxID=1185412 RepID=A0A8J8MB90_9FIRM|nr:hypothetical protein [Vallitalea guaymasensis]QUH29608.1 hypothetical protein HYG85_12110 [Vallitalea guaymasensis]